MATDLKTLTAAGNELGIGVAGVHHAIKRGRIVPVLAEDSNGGERAIAIHKDAIELYKQTRKGGRTPVSALAKRKRGGKQWG